MEKRLSHGLIYLLSYTWSKSIDVGCSGSFGVEGCGVQNPYNINADKGPSGFDIPQTFSASWNWELPFRRHRNHHFRLVNALVADWQINGILSLYSGVPFNVTVDGGIANTGNNYERANLVLPDPYPSNRGPAEWLNPAAFSVPQNYTFWEPWPKFLANAGNQESRLLVISAIPSCGSLHDGVSCGGI